MQDGNSTTDSNKVGWLGFKRNYGVGFISSEIVMIVKLAPKIVTTLMLITIFLFATDNQPYF